MSGAIKFHAPGPDSDIHRRNGKGPASAEIMAE